MQAKRYTACKCGAVMTGTLVPVNLNIDKYTVPLGNRGIVYVCNADPDHIQVLPADKTLLPLLDLCGPIDTTKYKCPMCYRTATLTKRPMELGLPFTSVVVHNVPTYICDFDSTHETVPEEHNDKVIHMIKTAIATRSPSDRLPTSAIELDYDDFED